METRQRNVLVERLVLPPSSDSENDEVAPRNFPDNPARVKRAGPAISRRPHVPLHVTNLNGALIRGLEHALHRPPREGATREKRRGHNSSPQLSQGCGRVDTTKRTVGGKLVAPRGSANSRTRYQRSTQTAAGANGRRRGDSDTTQRSRLASGPPRNSSRPNSQQATRDTVGDVQSICRERCTWQRVQLGRTGGRRLDRPRRHKDVPPLDLSGLHLDSDEDHSDKRKEQSGRRNARAGLTTPLLRRP